MMESELNLINRDADVITGNNDLELLHIFKDFPVFMGCVDNSVKQDLLVDMKFWISKSSGCIQINPLIPEDILYSQSHNSGVIGRTWERHHLEFLEFIASYSCCNILEIGGGHGNLARNYILQNPSASWTLVDPNPSDIDDQNIEVIKGFFDESFKLNNKIDAVVHSHVLEHFYNPIEFMDSVESFIDSEGVHIFSVPDLQAMFEKGYTQTLFFEHTIYLTENYIDYMLHISGFKILQKKYHGDGHSIFYATKSCHVGYKRSIPDNYNQNKKVFEKFIQDNDDYVSRVVEKMNSYSGTIFLFGGHIFSQYLLNSGLDEQRVECIIDNDPTKQGKRLYGTNLKVYGSDKLAGYDTAAVILHAGWYHEEIKCNIRENVNNKVIFWE